MKRCPTCQKTFADSMRFCQIDGTLLVEETENADSSETIVTSRDENASSIPFDQNKTVISDAPFKEEGNLQLPKESNLTEVSVPKDETKINDLFSSEAPKFNEPDFQTYQPPPAPSFKEPEQTFGTAQTPFNESPFGQPMQQSNWTPPPAPEANWQNQNIGANTPFQPPMIGQGQDKTLAIVSLVCGILSLTCCGPFTGIAALITGYMAKNNVETNPQQYDGRGLAIAGMIMGGISLVLTVLYFILIGFAGLIGR